MQSRTSISRPARARCKRSIRGGCGRAGFRAASAFAPEGDGYIISVVYRAATNTSELLGLNARDIAGEPAAVLKVPRRVLACTHGTFVAA